MIMDKFKLEGQVGIGLKDQEVSLDLLQILPVALGQPLAQTGDEEHQNGDQNHYQADQ